jgi:hypothetical protein
MKRRVCTDRAPKRLEIVLVDPGEGLRIKRPERRSAPHREVTLGVLQRWQHIERDPTLELEAKARALIFAADAQEFVV